MIDITDRVRNKALQAKIVSAEEAAAYFKEGMNVAMSGFTASAYAKAVPLALAERMKKFNRDEGLASYHKIYDEILGENK